MKKQNIIKIALLITAITALILTPLLLRSTARGFVPDPQTAYAREFIDKCDGQQWFIEEVERMLNIQEKTLDTIDSRADFDYIISFGLKNSGISGKLPRAFGELHNLRSIFLSENSLTGSIPAEIFTLSKLENLDLSNNKLSGSISSDVEKLTALKVLLLWNNQFKGAIPAELGSLTSLVNLDLASNNLTGQVPDSLGNLSNLQILALSDNPLDTVIPMTFGDLTSLKVLLMWSAGVKGTIPAELGNAVNLQILDVADNKLTGGFPATFGQLTALEKLTARDNKLNAALPPEMGAMASLEILDFPGNLVPGEIPATFGNLTKLQDFTANHNQLEGQLPPELGGMTDIVIFDLANNTLVGIIPQEFETMTKTETFLLNNNKLEGKIPAIFDGWTVVKAVNLSANTLVGDAPQMLATKQKSGTDVNLKTNYLAGSVLKTMTNVDDNFIDGLGSSILEHRLHIQSSLRLDVGSSGNLYALLRNYDARINKQSIKPKLPVARYSFTVISGDAGAVALSQDENGFYVKAIAEIKLAAPVIIEIVIIGDEGNIYPTTKIQIVTEKTSSGGGGGGGGVITEEEEEELPTQSFTHTAYIQGYADGTVQPDGNITRAELAMILYRTYDDPRKGENVFTRDPFPDAPKDSWYGTAVSYSKKIGLMQGDPDGNFRPDDRLTRAEFAATIARLRQLKETDGASFEDTIGHWANGYIGAVNRAGYMIGYPDDTFRPGNNITRAEVMTAMNRLFGRKPSKADILAKTENPYSDLAESHWAYEQVLEASISHECTLAETEVWFREAVAE